MPAPRRVALLVTLLLTACQALGEAPRRQSIEPSAAWVQAVEGTQARAGLLTMHVDPQAGRVLLALPGAPDADGVLFRCLWVEGLRTGLGSNPVGLDRGQWGEARLVQFRRVGARVLLVEPNLRHGDAGGDSDERRAAAESFSPAVLWSGEVLADAPDGGPLVDFSSFLLADAHGVVQALRRADQGSFRLDAQRSLIEPDGCLAFPDNLEFEALLTFAGEQPGPLVSSAAADPTALSLVQHHSLVRLPDDGYRPRLADPRAGSFSIVRRDVSADLDEPVERRLATRHRVAPKPDGSPGTLTYYVDRGAPEPVRSALLEGARWWSAAFAAAGLPGAFAVELLPEGAHPLDVRYHVIEWVHRTTRGWSYGHSIVDPRTGEIIKGHVSLGSLRVRHDRMLFEGLLGTGATGSGRPDDPVQLSLARIRQLAAHEVGHTLGLAHHFGASALPDGSVMDYPAPRIGLDAEGGFDLSSVYGVGIGAWDRVAIDWLYGDHGRGEQEAGALDGLLRDAAQHLPPFLSDGDARAADAAHPRASLWDGGADPVLALQRTLAVRALGLARFGPDRLAPGRPLAEAAEVFAPVWLHHRYQLEAALKVLGGVEYQHAVAGDGAPPPRPAAGAWQRRALDAVLACLQPAALDVPDNARDVLVPAAPWDAEGRELLPGDTGPVFDALAAAAVAADLVVAGLLEPTRCARLLDQHRLDPALPGLDEVLAALTSACLRDEPLTPRLAAVAERLEVVLVDRLVELASRGDAPAPVRARAELALARVAERFGQTAAADGDGHQATRAHLARLIEQALERDAPPADPRRRSGAPPPGSPIGDGALDACSFGA